VVGHARLHVPAAVHDSLRDRPHPLLVDAEGSGVRPVHPDHPVHHRTDVAPVGIVVVVEGGPHTRLGAGQRRGVGAVEGRAGRDQGQAQHPLGMLHGQVLRDAATHGDPDEVR
jgi:hypothetical protein